jgi:transcription initiation factor IIE alpha subunit
MLNMINFDLCLPTLSTIFGLFFSLATGKLTMHSIAIENNNYYTCLKKEDYFSLLTLLHIFQIIFMAMGKLTMHSIVIENNNYYTCLKKEDYYSLLTLLHSF